MHELVRARAILQAAAELAARAGEAPPLDFARGGALHPPGGDAEPVEAPPEKIAAVNVELNPLAGADEEELGECFLLAARGTPFAGARLRVSRMRLKGECRACGREVEITGSEARCVCGEEALRLPVEEDWRITGLDRSARSPESGERAG
jgi:Zn finger protein HypA/HybF involved in hydrogenase expression